MTSSGVSYFSDLCKDQVGTPPVGATGWLATAAGTLIWGDIRLFTGTKTHASNGVQKSTKTFSEVRPLQPAALDDDF